MVFDASGSKATVASVVTTRRAATALSPEGAGIEREIVFKDDKAAEMVKSSSGQWQVTSLKQDFHPGYEP